MPSLHDEYERGDASANVASEPKRDSPTNEEMQESTGYTSKLMRAAKKPFTAITHAIWNLPTVISGK